MELEVVTTVMYIEKEKVDLAECPQKRIKGASALDGKSKEWCESVQIAK